jgi:hypothetical protein
MELGLTLILFILAAVLLEMVFILNFAPTLGGVGVVFFPGKRFSLPFFTGNISSTAVESGSILWRFPRGWSKRFRD